MTLDTCESRSFLPETFTYYYFGAYFGFLFIFSLWAAHALVDVKSLESGTSRGDHCKLGYKAKNAQAALAIAVAHDVTVTQKDVQKEENDNETDNKTDNDKNFSLVDMTKKRLKRFGRKWIKSIKHFKSCYFMTINHIFDQVTDVGVIIEFLQLWQLERKHNNEYVDYCPGINAGILAACSIFAVLLYRIASTISIYRLTNDPKRIFFQFFDLELFRAMYVNYINDSVNPCNPQRWIQSLESFLESTPQSLIQLYFVIKSSIHGRSVSDIVYISTFWSIWIVALRAVSEDRLAFAKEYQDAGIGSSWSKNAIKTYFCVKKGYLLRLVYRFMDVLLRLAIILLVWLFMGGFIISVILIAESLTLLLISYKTNELSLVTYTAQ